MKWWNRVILSSNMQLVLHAILLALVEPRAQSFTVRSLATLTASRCDIAAGQSVPADFTYYEVLNCKSNVSLQNH